MFFNLVLHPFCLLIFHLFLHKVVYLLFVRLEGKISGFPSTFCFFFVCSVIAHSLRVVRVFLSHFDCSDGFGNSNQLLKNTHKWVNYFLTFFLVCSSLVRDLWFMTASTNWVGWLVGGAVDTVYQHNKLFGARHTIFVFLNVCLFYLLIKYACACVSECFRLCLCSLICCFPFSFSLCLCVYSIIEVILLSYFCFLTHVCACLYVCMYVTVLCCVCVPLFGMQVSVKKWRWESIS